MKYREKLGYIALGGVLMLFGILAAGLFSPLGAQNDAPDVEFGIITCEQIIVKNAEGEIFAGMGETTERGIVFVKGSEGTVSMSVDKDGGFVMAKGSVAIAEMGVNQRGGSVSVVDKDKKSLVSMRFDRGDGVVLVRGKDGKTNSLRPK